MITISYHSVTGVIMINLTKNEKKLLLILLKGFNEYYNSNSISKVIGLSRVGTMKIFKKLKKEEIINNKNIGRAVIYTPNFENEYTQKLMISLLAEEANEHKRWKEEFKKLFKEGRIIILYGSIIKNYEVARDIDLMILQDKREERNIRSILREKEKILPKKLHPIIMTTKKFLEGIKNKNKIILNLIKNSVILYGQEKYLEVIKNVSSR
ncbi:hypothetical protein COU61_00405 [Candidatus Pacearchaeota archaeon CG10_big_fil_rev_8_21_14_0_10_35_13]|nr:MAG: hypothetical protein COU61_00405 [Candidatus Pacearchaeota archaeon CG10_big_fil_rev_8_21_14_0_10_35_13]